MKDIKLTKEQHKTMLWVRRACDPKYVNPAVRVLHYNAKEKHLAATDGKRLHIASMELPFDEDTDFQYPSKTNDTTLVVVPSVFPDYLHVRPAKAREIDTVYGDLSSTVYMLSNLGICLNVKFLWDAIAPLGAKPLDATAHVPSFILDYGDGLDIVGFKHTGKREAWVMPFRLR